MGPELGPVEAPSGRHQHEQVVVLAAADDDRPQQRPERDALEGGALLGAARALGAHDLERDRRFLDRVDGRGRVGDRSVLGVVRLGVVRLRLAVVVDRLRERAHQLPKEPDEEPEKVEKTGQK